MGEKLPVPAKRKRAYPEFNLHVLVADYFRAALAPSVLWMHIPNQMTGRTPKQAAQLLRMGLRPGAADFALFWSDGAVAPHVLFIELKAAGGSLSTLQIVFGMEAQASGAIYCQCRTLRDVEDTLACAGVPMRGRIAA